MLFPKTTWFIGGLSTEVNHNSRKMMWLGLKFPDRENYRRTLAKFAFYNNFTIEYLKTNMAKVSPGCKDRNCPLLIYAFIIESVPRFKVRTYNPTHCCSKPMMDMLHWQASSELIVEYILDNVYLNNDLKPKEIMNDYQMEFEATISYTKAHITKEIAVHIVRGL